MPDGTIHLEKSWKQRKEAARMKAMEAISGLQAEEAPINFNSVHKRSRVSKTFLYDHPDIRRIIEGCRRQDGSHGRNDKEMNRRAGRDPTSSSKEMDMEAPTQRIAELEGENRKLNMICYCFKNCYMVRNDCF